MSSFEKAALVALGDLVETSEGQFELAKDAAEETTNANGTKSNVKTNEQG